MKPMYELAILMLVSLFAFHVQPAKADCQSGAMRLDEYEQMQQSEGGYLRAIVPLLTAVRKYEDCRTATPFRSQTWIDETLAEGYDTFGLAVDYHDARGAIQARGWESATFHLISDLCQVKTSLSERQELRARMLVSLYNISLSRELPRFVQVPDCFNPAVR